jgi:hypothetical protein
MKYFVVFLIAAALPFANSLYGQSVDSLFLSSADVAPGDTAVISLYLSNQSFAVGGFRFTVIIPDSNLAHFTEVSEGNDIIDFGYFDVSPLSGGTVGIIGIANMPNNPGEPLSPGYHEIARLKIAASDSITEQIDIPVVFASGDSLLNIISDESGYVITRPERTGGSISIEPTVSIDDEGETPSGFELKGNYPNPFNSHTVIRFSITQAGYVSIEIYDIQGRCVRELTSSYHNPGEYRVDWDGRSNGGAILSSGVYLYSINYNGITQTGKMNYIK